MLDCPPRAGCGSLGGFDWGVVIMVYRLNLFLGRVLILLLLASAAGAQVVEEYGSAMPSGALTIRFTAAPRRTYSIQFREAASNGGWNKLTEVPSDAVLRLVDVLECPRLPHAIIASSPVQP